MFRVLTFFGLIGASLVAGLSVSADSPVIENTTVWVAEIRGTINPAVSEYLKSVIQKAEKSKNGIVLIEMDTPGGLLQTTRTIAQQIDASEVPVVVYVTPAGASATSAGALIMFSSHFAAMAPGTNIGAAHPVGPEGKDVEGAMGDKVLNDTTAFARSMAELRGRNVALAEAVVSKSKSFTSEEALKEQLIEFVSPGRAELISALDGKTIKVKNKDIVLSTKNVVYESVQMTMGQKLLNLLAHPNVAAIFMTLAMLLIYVEVSNPGITIAGVAGVICLLIAFMAFQILPIQTGGVALLALGMILMVAEPFVGSGGALAVGGVISFILGLIWIVDPSKTDLEVERSVLFAAAGILTMGALAIGIAAGRTRMLHRRAMESIGGGSIQGLYGYRAKIESLGGDKLRGKIRIRGEIWNFISDDLLSESDHVEVYQVKGMKALVRKSNDNKISDKISETKIGEKNV